MCRGGNLKFFVEKTQKNRKSKKFLLRNKKSYKKKFSYKYINIKAWNLFYFLVFLGGGGIRCVGW